MTVIVTRKWSYGSDQSSEEFTGGNLDEALLAAQGNMPARLFDEAYLSLLHKGEYLGWSWYIFTMRWED